MVVANLALRKMKFGISEGMVLAPAMPTEDESGIFVRSSSPARSQACACAGSPPPLPPRCRPPQHQRQQRPEVRGAGALQPLVDHHPVVTIRRRGGPAAPGLPPGSPGKESWRRPPPLARSPPEQAPGRSAARRCAPPCRQTIWRRPKSRSRSRKPGLRVAPKWDLLDHRGAGRVSSAPRCSGPRPSRPGSADSARSRAPAPRRRGAAVQQPAVVPPPPRLCRSLGASCACTSTIHQQQRRAARQSPLHHPCPFAGPAVIGSMLHCRALCGPSVIPPMISPVPGD